MTIFCINQGPVLIRIRNTAKEVTPQKDREGPLWYWVSIIDATGKLEMNI